MQDRLSAPRRRAATRAWHYKHRTLALSGLFIGVVGLLGFAKSPGESRPSANEWIVAPRFLTLKPGISKQEARDWLINEYLPLYRQYPGFNAMLGEPLQSGGWGTSDTSVKEKGDFVLVYVFDTRETKDRYFPPAGGWSEEIARVVAKHQSTVDQLFGKYFIRERYQMEEYLMFAAAK